MYTQIMKKILLIIDFQQKHIDEFLTYCREQCVYPSFLYSMLNRALRMMEIDLTIELGFFVRDLHENIAARHSEQDDEHHHLYSIIVYRGQGLSQTDFDQLMTTKDGLIISI